MNNATFPAIMCIALIGSLTAFLFHNFHPARIFLGDTGSMLLGYALANITLMGSLKSTGASIFMAPLLVLGLPILDTLISITRRVLRGRPIFRGDKGHLHHRLLKKGFSQRKSSLIFYVIAMVMTASAVISWALPSESAVVWLAYAAYLLSIYVIIRIADLGPPVLMQLVRSHQRNSMFSAFSQYISRRLENDSGAVIDREDKVLGSVCQELRLRYLAIEREDGPRVVACLGDTVVTHVPDIPLQQITVQTEHRQLVQVWYQSEEELDEIAKSDLEDCLASIFEKIMPRRAEISMPVGASVPEAIVAMSTTAKQG